MAEFQVRSASTQVLTNSDLLHYIFAFVPTSSLPGFRRIKLGQLVPCASTCRAFHEPAIRLLWRKLDTFLPLWQLLAPSDTKFPCYNFHGDTKTDYPRLYKAILERLCDDPTLWDRFLWHTAHVREIAHDDFRFAKEIAVVHRLLMQVVITQNGGKTVFPLLRSIHWSERTPEDGSLISLFTSTLRQAKFSFSEPADEMAHALILRRLCESAPYLEKITITTNYDRKSLLVGQRIVHELLSFDRLCEVDIYSFTGYEVFQSLISKPNLSSLAISTLAGSWVGPLSSIDAHNLRKLSVVGEGPQLCAFFSLVRFHALESVSLNMKPLVKPLAEAIAALTTFCSAVPASLPNLELCFSGYREHWDNRISLRDVLSPVLALRELRTFRFSTQEFAPDIKDADIEAIVAAWPKLERLQLEYRSFSPHTLSLRAIHRIRSQCPNIQVLAIADIRCPVVGVHPLPPALDSSLVSQSPPRYLFAGGRLVPSSPGDSISDEAAEAVARYLLELFPASNMQQYAPIPVAKKWTSGHAYPRVFCTDP